MSARRIKMLRLKSNCPWNELAEHTYIVKWIQERRILIIMMHIHDLSFLFLSEFISYIMNRWCEAFENEDPSNTCTTYQQGNIAYYSQ